MTYKQIKFTLAHSVIYTSSSIPVPYIIYNGHSLHQHNSNKTRIVPQTQIIVDHNKLRVNNLLLTYFRHRRTKKRKRDV